MSMHPKIQEIAAKAGMVKYPTGLGVSENTIWGDRNIEEFAKMLLQEAIDQAHNVARLRDATDDMVYGADAAAGLISKHFGLGS